MIPEILPAVGGKADFKALLCALFEAALIQIITRRRTSACLELEAVELHRLFHHFGELCVLVSLFLSARIAFGDRHTCLTSQYLYGLHEADIFSVLYKGNRIPFGVTAKAIVVALAVIDMEGGGFFVMKGAWCPHVALALV